MFSTKLTMLYDMNIIAIMNYKGGVGKTTVTSNIAAELAYRGKRVLMIDLDPQSSLTFSFIHPDDWKDQLSSKRTIKNWFASGKSRVTDFRSLIVKPRIANEIIHRKNNGSLSLIASHLDLINVDLDLATELSGGASRSKQREKFFEVFSRINVGIESIKNDYDYVLMDCPPNFNIITKNAIVASQYILIPAKPDYLSTLGITYLKRNLNKLKEDYNHFCDEPKEDTDEDFVKISPEILGIVFTMVQFYNGIPISSQRQYIRQIKEDGNITFSSLIRDNKTIFGEAPQYLIPVTLDKGTSKRVVVNDIEKLVDEIEDEIL